MEDWSLPHDLSSIATSIGTPRQNPDVRDAQVAYWEFLKSTIEEYGYPAIRSFFPTVNEGLARQLKMKPNSRFDKISFSEICSIKPALSEDMILSLLSWQKAPPTPVFSSAIVRDIHTKSIPIQVQYWSTVKHLANARSGNLELRKYFPHVSPKVAEAVACTNLLGLYKMCEGSSVSTICSSIKDGVLLGNLGDRPNADAQFKMTLQLLSSSRS